MEPVNWIAVILAALAAGTVLIALDRGGGLRRWAVTFAVLLVPAAMLGHSLARIGAEKLALKPWLYFMQSGGLALAFVIPALWLNQARHGVRAGATLQDSAGWLIALLVMGGVFFVLA